MALLGLIEQSDRFTAWSARRRLCHNVLGPYINCTLGRLALTGNFQAFTTLLTLALVFFSWADVYSVV